MKIARPRRVKRSYTQQLVAEPTRVFPLLCPVREADWIEGWNPLLVLSESGLAERDCVFTTAATAGDAVWYVTRHEPAEGFVEMIKITPAVTACRLSIQLLAIEGGSEAVVTYTHTSLGPEGDAYVDAFTEEHYIRFMRQWQTQINHYLLHGHMLASAQQPGPDSA
jgi:hypothetical protein